MGSSEHVARVFCGLPSLSVLSDGSDHSEGVDSDETGDTSVNEASTEEEDEDDDDDEEDEEEVAVEM